MLLPHRMNMVLSRNNSNQDAVELPLYNIVGWELTQRNMDCPEEGIRMVVVLRRKPWREVFTTYLPTILLMMTTYVTTFFKSEFFEAWCKPDHHADDDDHLHDQPIRAD